MLRAYAYILKDKAINLFCDLITKSGCSLIDELKPDLVNDIIIVSWIM